MTTTFQTINDAKYHLSAVSVEQRMAILRAGRRRCYVEDFLNLSDAMATEQTKSQIQMITSEAEYFALMKRFAYAQPGRKWSREEMNER